MSCNETRFLVDTNALSKIGRHRRTTEFFLNRAALPSEVLHEASKSPDIETLQTLEFETTPAVLRALREVMDAVVVEDSTLLDLYRNQGGADPLMIACALAGRNETRQRLFGEEWLIVTEDKAVCTLAGRFGIKVVTPGEFARQIDEAAL